MICIQIKLDLIKIIECCLIVNFWEHSLPTSKNDDIYPGGAKPILPERLQKTTVLKSSCFASSIDGTHNYDLEKQQRTVMLNDIF